MKKKLRKNKKNGRSASASAVARLVIWSIVLCLLVGVFAVMMALDLGFSSFYYGDDFMDFDDEDYRTGNGSTMEAVHEISIDWVAGSVTVVVTDGDEIRVTEDYDGDEDARRMRWQVEDGELSVKYSRPKLAVGAEEAKNLTVEIPRAALTKLVELQVSTVSAAQDISVSVRELDVDTVSGRVNVRGDYESVDAESTSGDVCFDGSFREGSFDSVSGAVEIRLQRQASALDMDTVSGEMRLTLPRDITGFRVDAESMGRTNISGFDMDYNGMDRWGDRSMNISMDGVSGKLTIEAAKEAEE